MKLLSIETDINLKEKIIMATKTTKKKAAKKKK